MDKLTRAILVGICTALFAVLVLLVTLFERQSSFVDILLPGAGFLAIVLDPEAHTFYLYGNAFETIAVSAISWFLVGAAIGFFFKKIIYITGAWFVAYVSATIIAFVVQLLFMT